MIAGLLSTGCRNSNRAGQAALRSLEQDVDVNGLQQWSDTIITSTDPRDAFAQAGGSVPAKLLKGSVKKRPELQLIQLGSGDWIIKVDGGFGPANYGLAFGKPDTRFRSDYKVYVLKKGVFYFYASY